MTLGRPQAHALVGLDADDLLGAAARAARAGLAAGHSGGRAAGAGRPGRGRPATSSPKFSVRLTNLSRAVCHSAPSAPPPRRGERAYLSLDEVVEIARAGAAAGCREALF